MGYMDINKTSEKNLHEFPRVKCLSCCKQPHQKLIERRGMATTYVGRHQTPLCVWPGQHIEPELWPVEQPVDQWRCLNGGLKLQAGQNHALVSHLYPMHSNHVNNLNYLISECSSSLQLFV